jgi:dGTPase
MKYPKESLPKTNKKDIADKKYGFFQTDKSFLKKQQRHGINPK